MLHDGRFRIERELGRGGMATVYLATDEKHGRRVALKVLRPEVTWPGAHERFHREIRLAARLAHPNIVPLFDSGNADGALYFVMQYVDGAETLRDRLVRDGALPVSDVASIARDVAAALDYAHRQGVVHRDLKPENILLAEGRALVLDFGIARALSGPRAERTTEAGLALGTPAYMSPEQASAAPDVGPASDLYALGCVLYEMLAGEPPFAGTTAPQVLAQHVRGTPPPLVRHRPDVPPELARLVARLMEKDPDARPRHASEVVTALEGQPPGARPGVGWAWAAGGLALAGLAIWLAVQRGAETGTGDVTPDPAEVAVLYLAASDSGLRPLAAGLTEALIDRLSRVEGLRVRSADAVRPYRDSRVAIDSVAQRLRVGTIVSGEVSGPVEAPRLSIRLLAADATQLDARTVVDTGGALGLERELAEEVATFLRPRLGRSITLRARRAGTASDRAWLLLLRGEELRAQALVLADRGDTSAAVRTLAFADSMLAASAAVDERWPDPHLIRGWLQVLAHELTRDSSRRGRAISAGYAHAERALRLAPALPEAFELRGMLRGLEAEQDGRTDSALVELAVADLRRGAGPDNPHQARALSRLSGLLLDRGRIEEARVVAEQAYARDAFLEQADRVIHDLYHTSLYLERWDEARRWCLTGYQRFPADWLFTFCQLALQVLPVGEAASPGEAWQLVARLDTLSPPADRTPERWRMMVAGVLARGGLGDSARHVIAGVRATGSPDPQLDFYEAVARVHLGDQAGAIGLLRGMLERDPGMRPALAGDPAFKPLAGTPAFDSLMR